MACFRKVGLGAGFSRVAFSRGGIKRVAFGAGFSGLGIGAGFSMAGLSRAGFS